MTAVPAQTRLVRWRLHLATPPEMVYQFLASDAGRAAFWAEAARQEAGVIEFAFPNGMRTRSRVIRHSRGGATARGWRPRHRRPLRPHRPADRRLAAQPPARAAGRPFWVATGVVGALFVLSLDRWLASRNPGRVLVDPADGGGIR